SKRTCRAEKMEMSLPLCLAPLCQGVEFCARERDDKRLAIARPNVLITARVRENWFWGSFNTMLFRQLGAAVSSVKFCRFSFGVWALTGAFELRVQIPGKKVGPRLWRGVFHFLGGSH